MQVAENGRISINGEFTGLGVSQSKEGTVVYTLETYNRFTNEGRKYKVHPIPQVRYSLAHDKPASGAAGRPVARLTRLAGAAKRRLGVLDGKFRIPDDSVGCRRGCCGISRASDAAAGRHPSAAVGGI